MKIQVPNLRIMVHYYHSLEHLFTTVTMYSDARREAAIEEMARTKAWFGGRFSTEHRADYMKRRLLIESLMHKEFAEKYSTPWSTSPVFFYIRPNLSISSIEEGLRQRADLDEPATEYLLVDLNDLVDTSQISFTVHDSHRSYRQAMLRAGFDAHQTDATSADDGSVFHIDEISDVYARHRTEEDISFEVQVWDPRILEPWRHMNQ